MGHRLVFVAALIALMASLGGCGQLSGRPVCSPETVSCGSGVVVRWSPDDVPVAASYRLCVNGDCELVEPVLGELAMILRVASAAAVAQDDVVVDLELLDEHVRVAAFRGAGHKTGQCCPGVAFHATVDGELTVDSA